MKEYSCERRVDKLGRIVLPIEVRNKLQLTEGSRLELSVVDEENITLKKINPIHNFSFIKSLIDALYSEIGVSGFVVCEGSMICGSGKYSKCDIFKISNELTMEIKGIKHKQVYEKFNLFNNVESACTLFPICNNGDIFGCLVQTNKLSADEQKYCDLIVKIISENI